MIVKSQRIQMPFSYLLNTSKAGYPKNKEAKKKKSKHLLTICWILWKNLIKTFWFQVKRMEQRWTKNRYLESFIQDNSKAKLWPNDGVLSSEKP
jgi:hypothetical protein